MRALGRLQTGAVAALLLILPQTFCLGEKCTICEGTDNVGSPDKILDLMEIGSYRCGDFNNVLAWLFPQEDASTSPECQWIQSLGSLCDCPREPRPDACGICSFSMGFPKRPLPFFKDDFGGVLTPTCEILQAFLQSTTTRDDDGCKGSEWIVSDYCGCGLINTEWHPSCSLCPSSQAQSPTQPPAQPPTNSADNILERDQPHDGQNNDTNSTTMLVDQGVVIKADNPLNNLALPFATCGELEETAQLIFIEDSEQCRAIQDLLGVYCGCPNPNNNPCHLCSDGTSPVIFPDKEVPFLSHVLSGQSAGDTPSFGILTCGMVESLALSLDADSDDCSLIQAGGSFCGCPPRGDHCEFCPGFEGDFPPPEYRNVVLPKVEQLFSSSSAGDLAATCETVTEFQYQLAPDDDFCHLVQYRSDLCGCNNGEFTYLNADTNTRRALLAWLPRITCTLSIMSALTIIMDVLATPARRKRVYNQLIMLMSIFDLIHASAAVLTTYPTPIHDEYGNDWKVYGAHGTDASCTAQGFVLQLGGGTSIFFNASLATYYVCVFVLGWKDRGRESRRVWIWFLALPIVVGLSLSFAAIPYYGNLLILCHVLIPPLIDSRAPRLLFVSIPAIFCLLWATAMMVLVYVSLRRESFMGGGLFTQARQRRRGEMEVISHQQQEELDDTSRRNRERIRRIKREVFWQCLFYMIAFYLTWPLWLYQTITYGTSAHIDVFAFTAIAVMISPFQGFFNGVVYFRPRYWRYFQKRRQLRKQEQQQQNQAIESRVSLDSAETTVIANINQQYTRNESTQQEYSRSADGAIANTQSHHETWEDDDSHDDEDASETQSLDTFDLDGRIEPSAIIADDINMAFNELRHKPTGPEYASIAAPRTTRPTVPNLDGAVQTKNRVSEEECFVCIYPEDKAPNQAKQAKDHC